MNPLARSTAYRTARANDLAIRETLRREKQKLIKAHLNRALKAAEDPEAVKALRVKRRIARLSLAGLEARALDAALEMRTQQLAFDDLLPPCFMRHPVDGMVPCVVVRGRHKSGCRPTVAVRIKGCRPSDGGQVILFKGTGAKGTGGEFEAVRHGHRVDLLISADPPRFFTADHIGQASHVHQLF